jgi:hypothetical protein
MRARLAVIVFLCIVLELACSSADFDTAALTTEQDAGDDTTPAETAPATDSRTGEDDAPSHHDSAPPADTGAAIDTATSSDTSTTLDTPAPTDTTTTPDASTAGFIFPKSSDSRSMVEDPYFGLPGDFIKGTRTTSLATAHRFSGVFQYENDLTGGSLSIDVFINGTKIGSIGPIAVGTTPPASFDFSFAPIAGPTFDVKYIAAPAADRLGTILVSFDVSSVLMEGTP